MSMPPNGLIYFKDLKTGMTTSIILTVMNSNGVGFAEVAGDASPFHLSEHFAVQTRLPAPGAVRTC